MRISEEVEHPVPVAQAFAMFTSASFHELRCAHSGALEYATDVSVEPDTITVVARRRMPTDDFPQVARKFVGDSLVIVETQRWAAAPTEGERIAAVTVEIEGVAVALTGSITLLPRGQVTIEQVVGDLKAAIPFLGGQIEKAAAPVLTRSIADDAQVGQQWRAAEAGD